MRITLENAINELNLMIVDEIKNLDDTEMKILTQEGKMRLERIKNNLDEFEMNALEIKMLR